MPPFLLKPRVQITPQPAYSADVEIEDIRKKRVGNFWLDLFVVKRQEQTTGWHFRALILLVDSKVVYKLRSGNPMLNETRSKRNPLGPLPEMGSSLIKGTIK